MFDQLFRIEKIEDTTTEEKTSQYDPNEKLLKIIIRLLDKETLHEKIKLIKDPDGNILHKEYEKDEHRIAEEYKDSKQWKLTDYFSKDGHQYERVFINDILVKSQETFRDEKDTFFIISYNPFNSSEILYKYISHKSPTELGLFISYVQIYFEDGSEYYKIETIKEKIAMGERIKQVNYYFKGLLISKKEFNYEKNDLETSEMIEYEGDRLARRVKALYQDGILLNFAITWDGEHFIEQKTAKVEKEKLFSKNHPLLAVMDTGFDFNHKDIVSHYWKNTNEEIDGKDNDDNGFIDDACGVNLQDASGLPYDNLIPIDDAHGTKMMGICVTSDCDNDFYSLHPELLQDISMLGIKFGLTSYDPIPDFDLIFKNLRKNGIKVLNMSFGMGLHPQLRYFRDWEETSIEFWQDLADLDEMDFKEIALHFNIKVTGHKDILDFLNNEYRPSHENLNKALERIKKEKDNLLFVVGAGNSGEASELIRPIFPQNAHHLDNVIIVASVTQQGKLSTYSNWSPDMVDVAAKGDELNLLDPQDQRTRRTVIGGTSSAAAQVSKLSSVIYDLFLKAGFNLDKISPVIVKSIILMAVTKTESLKGRVKTSGYINPQKAIELTKKVIKHTHSQSKLQLEDISNNL